MKQEARATQDEQAGSEELADLRRRHLRIGWWSLLLFMVLGSGLEAMHLFKLGWYLDVPNETRRVMFTLAHAHGTLFSIVHLCFASAIGAVPAFAGAQRAFASRLLTAGLVLMPAGFFLGGLVIYDGDPGVGVVLAPAGALCLFIATFLTARGVARR